jgi:outer membrane protein assembly factor BamB
VLAGRSNCYAWAEDDRFYALDLATGDQKWTLELPATPAAEFEDAALLAGDAELLTIDPTTGEVLGRTNRLGLDTIVPGVGPAAYVASEGGFIGCIRPEAAGYVAPSDLPPTR